MDTGWDSYDEVTKQFGKPIDQWMKEFEDKMEEKMLLKMQADINRLDAEVNELRRFIYTSIPTYYWVSRIINEKLGKDAE